MSEWAKELLVDVARDAERTLWPNGSAEWQAQVRILAVLERRLLGLLEAGQAMRGYSPILDPHEKLGKAQMAWDTAKANAVRP